MAQPHVEIFVITHACTVLPDAPPFVPIQAGSAILPTLPGVISDAKGDNISVLNPHYSELTAQYWVWKNRATAEYIGFFHYRRFLDFESPLSPDRATTWRTFDEFMAFDPRTMESFGWSQAAISRVCDGADIIVPGKQDLLVDQPGPRRVSVLEHYAYWNRREDIEMARQAIAALHPAYIEASDQVMHAPRAHLYNVFIMRRQLFHRYMAWLFDIFGYLSERIGAGGSLAAAQPRVFGYLGERLLNVFVAHERQCGCTVRELELVFGNPGGTGTGGTVGGA